MLAMKPTMEKMTKPANMLVKELMQQTIMESLWKKKKTWLTVAEAASDSLVVDSKMDMFWVETV